MRAAVAARTEFREEIRAHVAPAVSRRTIGNCLLAAGLKSRVPLIDTGVVKGSTGEVCIRVMDVYSADPVSVSYRSALAHDT